MPTRQNLSLTVNQPAANAVVKLNQPFPVSGIVLDQGPPEPHAIDSVTVQVDGGAIVRAALTHISNKSATEVSFHANVQVTAGADPHTVTVTATDDQRVSVKQTRQVFTGTPFAVDAPAVVVDVLSLFPFNESNILAQTAPIQKALAGLSASLASIGKIIAGPNFEFFNVPDAKQPSRLRIGFWIEDASFPVVKRDGLPLPVLSDQAAALGFNAAPAIPISDPVNSFGVWLPLGTIQKLVDAAAPGVKAAASGQGVSVDSIVVTTISPESVATRFAGHLPLDVPFDMTVTEVLGLKQAPDDLSLVPAVVSSSHSSGFGNVLDLIIAAVFQPFLAALAVEFVELKLNAGDADRQLTGLMQPLLEGLPHRFPTKNTQLLSGASTSVDFPTIVLQWHSFRSTSAAILGDGDMVLEARDQSEVGLSIDGPHSISGNEGELAGNVRQEYSFSLSNLAPDADKFTWQVSGAAARSGSVESTFGLGGAFTVVFPLPFHAPPGNYPFTLTLTGIETCGTDPKKTLSASASISVVLEVKHVEHPQTTRRPQSQESARSAFES